MHEETSRADYCRPQTALPEGTEKKIDEKGFFAKHWMKIIIGVVLFVNVAQLFVGEAPGAQGQRTQGRN